MRSDPESTVRATARRVLESEADAILGLVGRLDERFDRAVDLVDACRGRVVLTGIGKSGIICRKIAATLASTGVAAVFLHPAEAIHGDLGMVLPGDVMIAISNSGETDELVRLLEWVQRLGVPLVALTGNGASTLARHADVVLDCGVSQEACALDLVPTASTTAALALGDALALAVMEKRGFGAEEFARLHPGGPLGRKLLKVADLMRTGDAIPRVSSDTSMKEVIYEMSRKGLGITSVVDGSERVVGVISDGDLRRHLERDDRILARAAIECMTPEPKTIGADELATRALHLMEEKRITSLLILDEQRRLRGIIHLHDLWRTGMV